MKNRYVLQVATGLLLFVQSLNAFNGQPERNPIKKIDNQNITATFLIPDCGNQNWNKANNNELWNEPYWWDGKNYIHDLYEQTVDLSITFSDSCAGLDISCLLFCDLDGDDSLETVISSEQMGAAGLGWNAIRYNNLNTPAYAGGELRTFDERPVSSSLKYGFALEETLTGTGKIANIRFNTEAAPGTYYPVRLPLGKYKIVWTVSDSCGNSQEFAYGFRVKDCLSPQVHCQSDLGLIILPTGKTTVGISELLLFAEDNCTSDSIIVLGVQKCGAGTVFPLDDYGDPNTSVTFNCQELSQQCVELWAKDAEGNVSHCESNIWINDPLNVCDGDLNADATGGIKTPSGDGVEEVTVNLVYPGPFMPPMPLFDLTDANGEYRIEDVPFDLGFKIAPQKDDNPLNGLTTYDLVLMSKHILGILPFDNPYKMIAADINHSGSITTFDIVEARKLILGTYTHFPVSKSWRFIRKSYVFPNPNNPFQATFPEDFALVSSQPGVLDMDFVGIKIGDVNFNAVPNLQAGPVERSAETAAFEVQDRELKAGEIFDLKFSAESTLDAFQFTLLLNSLKVIQVLESEKVTKENFNLSPENALSLSIDGAQDFSLRFIAEKPGLLSQMLQISSAITHAEAYDKQGKALTPVLRFKDYANSTPKFELYPNPFADQTSIHFYLPESGVVALSVYDAASHLVYSEKGDYARGEHSVLLDKLPPGEPGEWFCELKCGNEILVRKMLKIK